MLDVKGLNFGFWVLKRTFGTLMLKVECEIWLLDAG
jgi:hypothetical protein